MLGVNWTDLFQVRDRWWSLVNTVMYIQVPKRQRFSWLIEGLYAFQEKMPNIVTLFTDQNLHVINLCYIFTVIYKLNLCYLVEETSVKPHDCNHLLCSLEYSLFYCLCSGFLVIWKKWGSDEWWPVITSEWVLVTTYSNSLCMNFITKTLHEILLGRSNQGWWDGRGM
jgi:hypothetical protein